MRQQLEHLEDIKCFLLDFHDNVPFISQCKLERSAELLTFCTQASGEL